MEKTPPKWSLSYSWSMAIMKFYLANGRLAMELTSLGSHPGQLSLKSCSAIRLHSPNHCSSSEWKRSSAAHPTVQIQHPNLLRNLMGEILVRKRRIIETVVDPFKKSLGLSTLFTAVHSTSLPIVLSDSGGNSRWRPPGNTGGYLPGDTGRRLPGNIGWHQRGNQGGH
jgi:hypothetical protein